MYQVYKSQTAHGCSPGRDEQSVVNSIVVQPLYGSVQLYEGGRHTSAIGSVHILCSSCRVFYSRCSVQFRKRTNHFTTTWGGLISKRHFVHPLYGSVQVPERVHCTAATGCVHKLVGPVEPRTRGVLFRERSCEFTTP